MSDKREDITRVVVNAMVLHTAREFARGLRRAETHCWNCDAEHAPDAALRKETMYCEECGVDLIPF